MRLKKETSFIHSTSYQSSPALIHSLSITLSFSFCVNETNSPSRAKFGPRLHHQTWLLYPPSSLSVVCAREPQHVLESASPLITGLFSPLLIPMTLWLAHLPKGRGCLPCFNTAEPRGAKLIYVGWQAG